MDVLSGKKPGYKAARVTEMASLYRERAINAGQELVFAEQIIKDCDQILSDENNEDMYILSEKEISDFVSEWQKKFKKNRNKKIVKSENEQKGENIMTDAQKKLISDLKAEFGEAIKDWKDEDFLNTTKVEEFRASLKATKTEVKAEQKNLSVEKYTTLTTYKDDGSTEVKANKECTYTWVDSDGKSQTETVVTDTTNTRMYSEEQVSKVEAEKTELSTKLDDSAKKANTLEAENVELKKKVEAQEKELSTFRTAEETRLAAEKTQKLEAIKAELKDNPYTKEFKDEDYFDAEKVQVAKDRQERDVLKAEKAELEALIPEDKKKMKAEKKDLSTGHKPENELNPYKLFAKLGTKE